MALSYEVRKQIHLQRRATPGQKYYGDDDFVYIGTEDKRLRRLEKGEQTTFSPTTIVTSNNVQGAIEEVSASIQNSFYQTEFTINDDFNSEVYVTILDTSITENSIISASVSIGKDRDADELEFVVFTCSPVNIVTGVSYQILVVDESLQAEGVYILNIIKK